MNSGPAFLNIAGAKAWITVWINGKIAYRITTKDDAS
jgi:hypothetical protein